MKGRLLFLFVVLGVLSVLALEIRLDGKLDEAQWQKAEEHSDFQEYRGNANKQAMPRTSFRILQDEKNIYLGVYCGEPEMSKLVAPANPFPWKSDLVELFFSPGCLEDEFYQFVVSAGNVRWCEYYREGGNIRPDPGYAPFWESAVYKGDDFWSIEIRFPLAGFYHTRNSQWKTTWLFNMTRDRRAVGGDSVTWSPLVMRNQDGFLFRKLAGFPQRPLSEDINFENAFVEIDSKDASGYAGKIALTIFSGVKGRHRIACGAEKSDIELHVGHNELSLPFHTETLGKRYMTISVDDSDTLGRIYPLIVDFKPIVISLTTPSYSNAFYPGQDKSRIEGTVQLQAAEKVVLTLEGDGIEKQQITMNEKEGRFSFKSHGLGVKGAVLTATTKTDTARVQIHALAPVKNRMVWLENGKIIVNGKPVFARELLGIGNYTGRKFNEIFDKDRETFHCNNSLVNHITIEPRILVNGIESEAILDKKPSQVLLDRITEVIEKNRNRDFTFYYLVDEPECRNISPVYLEYLYKHVKKLDKFHPVKLCTREPERFVRCADYITMHPYWGPVFDEHGKRQQTSPMDGIPSLFGKWQSPDKASGLVPQLFSYRNFWNRTAAFPTIDELESSIWASIISGAAGIHAYHYHDMGDRAVLYEGMRFALDELERLEPFIMSDDKKLLPSPAKTCAAVFTNGGHQLLALVNLSDSAVEMTAPYKNLHEFCGSRRFAGKVTLLPYQTALFTDSKMDQGLKSKTESGEIVAAQEGKRLGTKNIFLEKGFDINIDYSSCTHFNPRDWVPSKLFDGNFNVLAWGNSQGRDSWMELGFAKFTPEINRLMLHGYNMEKVKVSYWKNGGWKDLKDIATVKYERYLAQFTCDMALRTVKLRMDFPKNDQPYELYEIEAYLDGQASSARNAIPEKNPLDDRENILWRQDGTKIVRGKGGWTEKNVKVYANAEGNFTIASNYKGKDASPTADTYIPISAEYPWLVIRLNKVNNLVNPDSKYHAWCIQGPMMGVFFQDVSPIPGIYMVNMSEKQDLSKSKLSYIAVYAYNQELIFDDISIVKKTECMLSSQFTEDGISVTAELQLPAESVSVRVCHQFTPLTRELSLSPIDEKKLVWKGTFTFDTPLQNGKTSNFPAGQLNLRADILGGGIPVPVFSKIFSKYPL